MLLRNALASSYNIPAVKTLQFVGIYDNPSTAQPEGLIGTATRLGIPGYEAKGPQEAAKAMFKLIAER